MVATNVVKVVIKGDFEYINRKLITRNLSHYEKVSFFRE